MLESAIKEQISREITKLKILIEYDTWELRKLADLRDGPMTCEKKSEHNIRYYQKVTDGGHTSRESIGGPDEPLVIGLKKQRFYSEQLKAMQHDLEVLSRAYDKLEDYSAEAIHEALPKAYKNLPDECFDDVLLQRVSKWVETKYKRNSYELPDDPNIACDGTATRSKGETIVYDDLYHAGIPFMYDSYHKWQGRSGKVHGLSPAFLFKCQDGSLLVWEHLGLLGHDGYSDSVLERLNKYLDCGFVVGQNLILTSDNVYGNTNELMILEALEKVKKLVLG